MVVYVRNRSVNMTLRLFSHFLLLWLWSQHLRGSSEDRFRSNQSQDESPNQSQDEFETVTNSLELILDKIFETIPFLVIALGDFNKKLSQWYKNDKTTTQGSKIANFTSQYGLEQIINQPTHIFNNSSSFIDLLFTSQPNLVMESGAHSSLHSNCYHQIICARFNLKIYYPSPYEREIWYYNKANVDLIQQPIREFNWKRAFHRENVIEKVSILNNTINNVLSDFIPYETYDNNLRQ